MTKRCPSILHLSDAALTMVLDGVELLQPDSDEAQALQVDILVSLQALDRAPRFIDMGSGHFSAACQSPDCPNVSESGSPWCKEHDAAADDDEATDEDRIAAILEINESEGDNMGSEVADYMVRAAQCSTKSGLRAIIKEAGPIPDDDDAEESEA